MLPLTGRRTLLLVMTLVASGYAHEAQAQRVLPLDDWTYPYIQRLQRRGLLLDLPPTALPYTVDAVARALDTVDEENLHGVERRWVALLRAELHQPVLGRDEILVGEQVGAGLRATDNDRLDPLRYTDAGKPGLQVGQIRLFQHGHVDAFFEKGPAVAHLGVRHDQYYRDDPDGIESALRFITRNEDSYVGVQTRLAGVYLGRVANHWGTYGGAGTLVSDNPRTYDQLALRIGGQRFSVRSIIGELDSITLDDRFTGTAGADSVAGSKHRYLAAHRIDWRPSRWLSLTFMEATLYSGVGANFSLKWFNPVNLHVFSVDTPPKNDENNGFVGGMLWAHRNRWTLQTQITFDDFDFLGQTGEPISLASATSLQYAGALPNVDVGAFVDVVSSRSYNTGQREGQYVFLLRGLATQFNDYVHAGLQGDLFLDDLVAGLTLSPKVEVLWQGEQDVRRPFPGKTHDVGFVATGTVERTMRLSARLYVQRSRFWWLAIDGGVNWTSNRSHVRGVNETRFVGLVEAGARVSFQQIASLSFSR